MADSVNHVSSRSDLRATCIRSFAAKYPELWSGRKLTTLANRKALRSIKGQCNQYGKWDLFLDIPEGELSGMYLEIKHQSDTLTKAQVDFRNANGDRYAFAACYTEQNFLRIIAEYLKHE